MAAAKKKKAATPAEPKKKTKGQKILDFAADNPEMKPKELAALITKELGEEVSAQYVSSTISTANRKAGGGSSGSKDSDRQAVLEAVFLSGSEVTLVQELERLKDNQALDLVTKMGGIEKALAAVEKLKAWKAGKQTPIK